MSKNHNITIVTVTYNSMNVLPNMLDSISEDIPIILIDNGSKDINKIRDLTNKKNIQLIENAINIGFGAACNLGAFKAKTEFVMFLNPDATLNINTLHSFLTASKKYSDFSAMNPRIIGKNKKQFFKRRSHLLPRSLWMKHGWPMKDKQVSILSGSALFVKLKYFYEIGGFDENIFLFHEDDDLSLRLKSKCGPLMFIRDAVVTHDSGNSSIRSNENTALKAWHMGQSKIYTIKKHKIPFGITRAIMHALLKLFSPECIISKRKRIKNYYYFKGLIDQKSEINT
jgi:N-acetylglucosaminyl-diphospho-decaprenol L-rhamnosyltransferase